MKAARVGVFICLIAIAPALAEDAAVLRTDADYARAVSFEPPVGRTVPLDLPFTQSHRTVTLADAARGSPSLLLFTWFDCTNLCGLVLNALADASRDLGGDYRVIVVSMDATETARQAQAKQESLRQQYPDAPIETRWHFLTGNETAIQQLADSIGFHFFYDPRKQQFAHAAGVVALDSEGVIRGFQSGMNYRARDIEALLQATRGKATPATNAALLLLCYDYDPNTGRYSVSVMKTLRIVAALFVLLLAGAFTVWRRRERGRE